MIRILAFSGQARGVLAALDGVAAQAEHALSHQRGEVLDISHTVTFCGGQFIVALVVVMETDDLVA